MSEPCNFSGVCNPDGTFNYTEIASTHPDYPAQDIAPNRTFDMNAAPMPNVDEGKPTCCRAQDLPIYRAMRDRTITTAPTLNTTFPNIQSNCACRSGENIQQQQDPRRLNIPQGPPRGPPIPMQQGMNVTFNSAQQQMLRQPGNMPQPTLNTTRNVIQSPFNATRNVIRAVQTMKDRRDNTYINRPVGFEQFTQPPPNQTYSQTNQTYIHTPTTMGPDWSEEDTDLGPWRNFEIPKNLRRVDIAPKAYKTYPRMTVPPPSRNYSTYDDPQPIVNIREVAQHRKKAPRFYSTPTKIGFANQGTSISSVWGKEEGIPDSSYGWSQGVRMDSFNVIGPITPSPRRIPVPQRGYVSQRPPERQGNRIPTPHKTHTYLPNPRAYNIPQWVLLHPSAEASKVRGESARFGNKTRGARSAQPSPGGGNRTYGMPPPPVKEADCPCGPVAKYSEEKVEEAPVNKTEVVEKKEEGDEKAKDFCTVLEIRTPCAENPCKPSKPLQLSINVTCADPSMLVTPDKRFNVLKHIPDPPPPDVPRSPMDDVPSDCECGS